MTLLILLSGTGAVVSSDITGAGAVPLIHAAGIGSLHAETIITASSDTARTVSAGGGRDKDDKGVEMDERIVFTSEEVVFDIRAYPRAGWLGWLGRRLGWIWTRKV
jgi:hypothetical protein